jgi:hypothetical protein
MNLAQILLLSRLHHGNLVHLEGFFFWGWIRFAREKLVVSLQAYESRAIEQCHWAFVLRHCKIRKTTTVLDTWIKDPGILNNLPPYVTFEKECQVPNNQSSFSNPWRVATLLMVKIWTTSENVSRHLNWMIVLVGRLLCRRTWDKET